MVATVPKLHKTLCYVNYPSSSNFSPSTVLNKMMATASLMMPSPKRTEFKVGYFYAFISDMAATVSVAQRMAASIKTSPTVNASYIKLLMRKRTRTMQTNPKIVPMIPK